MKTIIICVIVIFYIILKKKEAIVELVKQVPCKDPVFYFPNTFWGRSAAAKLRRTKGYKFVTIILGFDQGTGVKLEHNMPIILMSAPDPNAAVIAVPGLDDDFHIRIDEVDEMIAEWTTNHTYVTVPTLQINGVEAAKVAYKNSRGTNRKGKFTKMMELINGVMFLYQQAANADKENSLDIIASGKFHVRGTGGGTKQIWELIKSEIAGEIILTGVVVKDNARTYNWFYSADGITWVRMAGTYYAHTKMSGLTPNTFAWFRYQVSLNDVPQGMSTELKVQVPA